MNCSMRLLMTETRVVMSFIRKTGVEVIITVIAICTKIEYDITYVNL